jgi:hypothetical protein
MRWRLPPIVTSLWTTEIHVDLRPVGRWLKERPQAVIVGLGVLLRLSAYLMNRAMWLDEGMLRGNIVDVPIFEFSAPLHSHQLAPFGFMVLQRILATFVGSRNYVLRFLPLSAGIAALYLFSLLAPRILSPRAALIALVLFACSDDLIYYSSELKPYSLDVAVSVAVTLAACHLLGRSPSPRAVVWLAVLATAAPWFSFPSAFVVAGCGAVLILDALREGRLGAALIWVNVGVAWLASFLVALQTSRTMLSADTPMYAFWDFAFLPLSLSPSRKDLLKAAGLLLEIFVNPLYMLTPGGTQLGVILPMILLLLGGLSLARRSPRVFLVLVAPIGLAIVAAVYRHYPFHGRLVLGIVPGLFLLIAEGTEWIARFFRSRSQVVYKMVLLVLIAYPCCDGFYYAITKRLRDFNAHGDLHPNVFIDVPVRKSR